MNRSQLIMSLPSSLDDLKPGLSTYINAMNEDYSRCGASAERIEEWAGQWDVTIGPLFMRLVHDGSVHSFIVLGEHARGMSRPFARGTILKAAGWAGPAKNFPRGFLGNGVWSWVNCSWTGAA